MAGIGLYSRTIEEKIASLLSDVTTLKKEGKPNQAVAKLNRALFLQPDNPVIFRERAEVYIMLSDFHGAIINLKRTIMLKEEDKEAVILRLGQVYYQYGVSLASENKYVNALEMFTEAKLHDPANKKTISRMMQCLIALKRYTECREMIEKEISTDTVNPDLFVIRAQLNIVTGEVTKGYWDVHKALQMQDGHIEALEIKHKLEQRATYCKNRAVHQTLAGKKRDALHKIGMAISSNPTIAEYHILRGSLFRQTKRFTAAVDDCLLAMDKCGHKQDSQVYCDASRQLVLTYNDFAIECFKRKKFEYAIKLLNRAIKEEREEKGLYLNRGDCFYRSNLLHFALCDYNEALELDPSLWDTYCRVAVVSSEMGVDLFTKGKFEKAEGFFTAAIHHNPKVARFYLCRARARLELKNIKGSKGDAISSLTLDPRSNECLSLIARVFPGELKEDILLLHPENGQIQSNMQRLKGEMLAPGSARRRREDEHARSKSYSPLHMFRLELKLAEEENEEERKSNEREGLERERGKGESAGDIVEEMVSLTRIQEGCLEPAVSSSSKLQPLFGQVGFLDGHDKVEKGSPLHSSHGLSGLSHLTTPPHPPLHRSPVPTIHHCLQAASFHQSLYDSKKPSTVQPRKVQGTSELSKLSSSLSIAASKRRNHLMTELPSLKLKANSLSYYN